MMEKPSLTSVIKKNSLISVLVMTTRKNNVKNENDENLEEYYRPASDELTPKHLKNKDY